MGERLSDVDELNRHLGQVKQHAAELVQTAQKMKEATRILQERGDHAESIVQEAADALSQVNTSLVEAQTSVKEIQRQANSLLSGLKDECNLVSAGVRSAHQRQLSDQEREGRALLERLDSTIIQFDALKNDGERHLAASLAEIDQVDKDIHEVLDSLGSNIEAEARQALEGAQRVWAQWRKDFEEEHLRRTELLVQTVKVQDQWVRGVVETHRQQMGDIERLLGTKADVLVADALSRRLSAAEQELLTRATDAALKAHESSTLERFTRLESSLAQAEKAVVQTATESSKYLQDLAERIQKTFDGLSGSVQQLQNENRKLRRRLYIAAWTGGALAVALFVIVWLK